MKVSFFFFMFVLNVLVEGILPYTAVQLGPSKLLSILTESYGMLTWDIMFLYKGKINT